MANKRNEYIKRLTKRRDWLDYRVKQMARDNPNKDMGFDKAESHALSYAIDELKREKPASIKEAGTPTITEVD